MQGAVLALVVRQSNTNLSAAFVRGPGSNEFNEEPRLTEAELGFGGPRSILNDARAVPHGAPCRLLRLLKHVSSLAGQGLAPRDHSALSTFPLNYLEQLA